ncbi:hypothetical protein BJ508DRAFT_366771 [Ascobolus immersus RN42]|uniref:Uncharacterized protein n=1 Tax=Ascobolus immersus RN42 TaxID=1160509 RepID=A0A3N4HH55_ASCIM|nr:hypothetical protein BJ508DRAFT_366771 [Ascobolus immersus RN42]
MRLAFGEYHSDEAVPMASDVCAKVLRLLFDHNYSSYNLHPRALRELAEYCMDFYFAEYLPFVSKMVANLTFPDLICTKASALEYPTHVYRLLQNDSSSDSQLGARHKAGLLRPEQVEVVSFAYVGVNAGLSTLMDSWSKSAQELSNFTADDVSAEASEKLLSSFAKFCLKELRLHLEASISVVWFFASLRSERLELLLLRYLREDGFDAELAGEFNRRQKQKVKELIFNHVQGAGSRYMGTTGMFGDMRLPWNARGRVGNARD